jgi:hypothetical protein
VRHFKANMPNFLRDIFLTLTLLLALTSCDRIKRKGHQVVDKTKETLSEKKANLGDKIFAHFDPHHPDTKFNRKRFSEFFKFEPTADVKNIYCYADEMGIDHDYQFAFNCDTSTAKKIVSSLNLKLGEVMDNNSSNLWHNFPWWDSAKIETLKPFFRKGDHETYWYLWYDTSKQKAYYFEFDM